MDINTPKGQETLRQERNVIAAFHTRFPNYRYVETNKDRDAVNDGIIFNKTTSTLIAVCETKCRGATLEQLQGWNFEWLITYKKIKRNMMLAREMRVFFTGLLYLVPDKLVLVENLYDGNLDKWLVSYRTDETETRRNINGGSTIRENAFVNMRGAQQFRVP